MDKKWVDRSSELTMKNKMWDIFQRRLWFDPRTLTPHQRALLEDVFFEIVETTKNYILNEDGTNEYIDEIDRGTITELQNEIEELEEENEDLKYKLEQINSISIGY